MALPIAITVGNYRCFAEPCRLELRPLTLLYGWNNAGKSALLRLLSIIADSVAESATSPFELSGEAGRKSSFLQVLSQSSEERLSDGLSITFHWGLGEELSRLEFLIDFSKERRRTYIREFAAFDRQESPLLRASAYPIPDRFTICTEGGEEKEADLRFTGLVPPARGDIPALELVRGAMVGLRDRIHWLAAVRARPDRTTSVKGATPRGLSFDGREAVDVLLSRQDVTKEVAGWFRDHTNRTLELKEVTAYTYRTLLMPSDVASKDIDIIDTGEGMTQILPVLVGAAMVHLNETGGRLLAVEEPESHLHPTAQRGLAEHLCHVANDLTRGCIILETHSFALMLGVQLAIARGEIDPTTVCAYWVEQQDDGQSVAELVEFESDGRPCRSWPPNIFATERELARELASEQLRARR
jgi:predicted ATPase